MLCFSHDWSGDPLSKTHLMRLLARENRILWVNSIGYRSPTVSTRDLRRVARKLRSACEPLREVEKNIFVINPVAVPAWSPRTRRLNFHLLRAQVRRSMRRLGFERPINWIFNPAAGMLAGALGEERVFYYCVDEYTAFDGVSSAHLSEIERGLIDRADVVFVSSERLQGTKRSPRVPTVLVRHGVDYEHFRTAFAPSTAVPADLAALPRPIIGYFGLIGSDWVDSSLVVHLARSLPGASIVMLGRVAMDASQLRNEPNIHLLGHRPYADLPAYCKGFDVAIVPFPISEVTLNANPLKAREYLAAGLPVVSTSIPEVRVLKDVAIGATPDDFVTAVRRALLSPGLDPRRSLSMQSESWDARLEIIRREVATACGDEVAV